MRPPTIPELLSAIRQKNKSQVRLLIDTKADIGQTDFMGHSPLHAAVGTEDVTLTQLLISLKANPFCRNKQGQTPLHLAASGKASSSSLEIAQLLIAQIW